MIYQPDDIIVGGDDTATNYEDIARNVGGRIVEDLTSSAQQLGAKLRATITGERAPANVSPSPVAPAKTVKLNPIVMVAIGALVVSLLLKKGKR